MKDLAFEIISDSSSPYFELFEERYLSDFPMEERREVSDLLRLLTGDQPPITIEAVLFRGEFAGFISYWRLPSYMFFEHFAITPSLRSRGIGREVIRHMQAKFADRPFLIEVEPPNDELKSRRVRLYEHLDFILSDFPYIQPSYRQGGLGVPLKLMTWNFNRPISQNDVLELKRLAYGIE